MDAVFKYNFLTDIDYPRLLIGIAIIFVCTWLIEKTYIKYKHSNDNKETFTKYMFPFTISTFFIVTVIKTSIALSLGLVGALSIIRFRTAIKEPGQLITLLVLTALSISAAAEKEILGLILTVIFMAHSYLNKNNSKNEDLSANKILRIIFDKNMLTSVSSLISIKGFSRIYNDYNDQTYVEYILTNKNEVETLINLLKEKYDIKTFEIL